MDVKDLDNEQLITLNKTLAKQLVKKLIIGAAITTAIVVTIAVLKSDSDTPEITE